MNKNLVRLLFAWFLVTLAFFGGQALAATPSVSAGGTHTCAVLSIGSVQCWGDNDFGQLGNGSYTGSRVPTPVSGLANATTVSLGYYHACAVLGGGTVQCWGAGETLGNGTTTGSNVPVTVSGIANATSVSAGQSHTCALLTSGGVRCWGDNSYGQLGNGSYNYGNVPVTVSGISNAIAVSAGQFHTCALLIGGAIQCWGYNRSGRLGNGNTTDSKVPVTVSGIASATAVSAGGSRTCAVLSSGEVRCWGDNGFGQLGNGSHTGGIFSVAVSGIASATSVSVGQNHSCSVLGGGGIQCWGGNDGQLGNGSKTSSNVPVAVTGVANATVVSAGASHTCAVLGSGTVQCWGVSGYFNRLGDGSTSDSTIPVQVVGTNGQGFLNLGGSSYTLTTSKTGTGQGSIASSSTGIACGSDCTENYANGTTVTLTATPSSGSTFTGWSGACSGTATCTVSMSEAKNVVATFNLVTISSYTLTVSKTGFGEGNIASSTTGISCGSDCTESYVSGTSVTLIATPSSGSTFTGWSGACSGTGTCTISMSEAKTVSAGFSLVLVSNLGAPVVSVSPVGLALGRSAEGNPITGVPTGTLFSFDFAPVNNAASYKLFYKLPGGQYTTESSIPESVTSSSAANIPLDFIQ